MAQALKRQCKGLSLSSFDGLRDRHQVKERVELRFKAAAFCDALTGIGNRRTFMINSE